MKNNFEDTMVLNELDNTTKGYILKNQELKKLIQFKLDKNTFEKADLIDIEDILLDGRTFNGDINIVDFNEIEFFPKLKKIEMNNLDISKEHMKKLENIADISFKNCKIESIKDIKNTKRISINNSHILDLDQIENFQNLIELDLINVDLREFNFLKKLINLQILKLKNVKECSLSKINFQLPIKYLSLEGMDKLEEKFLLENYPNLEILSIDLEKQKEWAEKLEMLRKKGIKIFLNDIYEY